MSINPQVPNPFPVDQEPQPVKPVVNRLTSRTPRFFRTLRTIGLALGAVSATVLASPIALPAAVITAAGYLAVGAAVLTSVSQLTVEGE